MEGLIVKPKWCSKILNDGKCLEVRGSQTSKINIPLYLLESGTRRVRGTFMISKCIPATKENWESLKPLHQVDISWEELLKIYKKPYFWQLNDVKIWDDVSYYEHPQGAVIWVKNVSLIDEMQDERIRYEY